MSIKVFFIGENTVTPPKLQLGTNTPKFEFMYMRMIDNGATWTSFSNDLEELKERMNKEIEEHG